MSRRHDLFWAEFFGIAPTEFHTPGLSIVRHVGLAGYRGVWFFKRDDRLVVSAPDSWLACIRRGLAQIGVEPNLPSQAALVALFGRDFDRCVGPVFQGALEAARFRPVASEHVRKVSDADSEAVSLFRAACSPSDWESSGLDKVTSHRAALFENGVITSMAGFRAWSGAAGDPCVLTRPDCRGSGRAKQVVSHVFAAALAEDRVLLYQTLEANVPAVRLALGLGYTRYANHLALRLTADRPSTQV